MSLGSFTCVATPKRDWCAESGPDPLSDVRLGLLGGSQVREDLVSMRAYLEEQLVQKSALLESVALKISQLENKVAYCDKVLQPSVYPCISFPCCLQMCLSPLSLSTCWPTIDE